MTSHLIERRENARAWMKDRALQEAIRVTPARNKRPSVGGQKKSKYPGKQGKLACSHPVRRVSGQGWGTRQSGSIAACRCRRRQKTHTSRGGLCGAPGHMRPDLRIIRPVRKDRDQDTSAPATQKSKRVNRSDPRPSLTPSLQRDLLQQRWIRRILRPNEFFGRFHRLDPIPSQHPQQNSIYIRFNHKLFIVYCNYIDNDGRKFQEKPLASRHVLHSRTPPTGGPQLP